MAYVHRRVVAGQTVEHRKMQSYRVHTKGVKRGPNKGTTTEKQAKINERVAEEHLRWDINANFKHKDLHAVLHYSFLDKPTTLRQILDDKAEFLKILRKLCRKHKVKPKVLVVIETKSMTNPHLHVIISRIDTEIIQDAWEAVPPQGGYISFQSLDNRGNHYKLAHYLVKESRDTMRRYREELGIRGKRYTKSQNMIKPTVTYEKVLLEERTQGQKGRVPVQVRRRQHQPERVARNDGLPIPGVFRGFQRIGGQDDENLHSREDHRRQAI